MKKNKSLIKEISSFIFQLFLAILIAVSLNSAVFAFPGVVGPSMENTFEDGQRLVIDRMTYNFSEPKYGDVIVFLNEEEINGFSESVKNTLEDFKLKLDGDVRRNRFIKRVVAVAGDSITIKDDKVYVNDLVLNESYSKGSTKGKDLEYPILVPEGKVFVLGDNRENSNDSRVFGLVDLKSIEGKVRMRLWPLNEIKFF